MKILCVIDSLGSGGAQRQLVELGKGFKENGHHVTFLIYHNIIFYKPELDKIGIPVEVIKEPNYFFRIARVRKAIRKQNPNIVLSFLEASNFICTIAGFPFREWMLIVGERSANPQILNSNKLKFYRWFHLFTDHVVANSYINLELVRKINPMIPQSKLNVIYNMIDLDYWTPNNNFEIKNRNRTKLVVAASHQYLKNCSGLIDALSLLNSEYLNKIEIDWYGDEKNDDSYIQAKQKLRKFNLEGKIKFHPAASNIKDKMLNADFVGLFSFHEGLPNVICEAMALGKPVMAPRVSDIPKIIEKRELLFDPNSPEEISEVLKKAITYNEKEKAEIGNINRNNAQKLFNKKHIMLSYQKLFDY